VRTTTRHAERKREGHTTREANRAEKKKQKKKKKKKKKKG